MGYLIKEEKLVIQHNPGKGAWTYHLRIPNTKTIKAKWGYFKVSGQIDNYAIEGKNLMPIKGSDKLLAVNETIRKAINKGAGDTVVVTLYSNFKNKLQEAAQIIECFKDAEVLNAFESLELEQRNGILERILSLPDEDQQAGKILKVIEQLK